jgi:1-deoxy-D-xylulose-5-phosphate reductoisomerase
VKRIAILGSTGSVGSQALEVIAAFPAQFEVTALAAGRNVRVLAAQIERFGPAVVSVAREEDRGALVELLRPAGPSPEILIGAEGVEAVAAGADAHLVLNAIVGVAGLRPTLAALRPGVTVAVANKEALVVGGALITRSAREIGAALVPVDSEHSAVFQLLRGQPRGHLRRLVLTGSGGPFRTAEDLEVVSREQALRHPTWRMGPKITIDSATLMNKGLEVIEARWLFDVDPERIDVLIHPQSVVHSLVELVDGTLLALLGITDMRPSIGYALAFPDRLPLGGPPLDLPPLDLVSLAQLTFEAPDLERFPCLALARRALAAGGTSPAILNAANEVAVEAFLSGRITLAQIPRLIERTMEDRPPGDDAGLDAITDADRQARLQAAARLDSGDLR